MLFSLSFFFFNDTATTEIYTLSLHDALPSCLRRDRIPGRPARPHRPTRSPPSRLWRRRDPSGTSDGRRRSRHGQRRVSWQHRQQAGVDMCAMWLIGANLETATVLLGALLDRLQADAVVEVSVESDAVVPDVDVDHLTCRDRLPAACRTRVTKDVGHRLRHDPVGGDLDRRRQFDAV